MKFTKYIWLLFIIALYVVNYFWLKIGLWTYTGMVLGILVVLVVAINIFIKIKNRKGKTDENFIFSEKTANIIKAVDMSTQYEASILSLFCLIIGMILFMIYVIFIAPYTLFFKIFISLNTLFGVGLMGSMLVTNYQQFVSYKESRKMLMDFSNQFGTNQFGTEVLSPDKLKPGKILTPLKPNEKTNSSPGRFNISKMNERRKIKKW